MRFGYYLLNTYVPELDGLSPDLYAHWLEQIDAAEDLGFDSLWVTEHHFRLFGGPETCVRHLQRIRDVVGPTHVGLVFHFGGLSQDIILKSMERFARFVMPALRE